MAEQVLVTGAGAVGTGLAVLLARQGNLVGLANRGEGRRARAKSLLPEFMVAAGPESFDLSRVSMVVIAVSDTALPVVGAGLAAAYPWPAGTLMVHTSGCLVGDQIPAAPGVIRGSFHPLCACPSPTAAVEAMSGAVFGIEGDRPAVDRLAAFADQLGGRAVVIPREQKPRYHAAAVLASNLVLALLDLACEEAESAGVDDPLPALLALTRSALEPLETTPLPEALTGPVARGDAGTVAAHLGQLVGESEAIYRSLSCRALTLARDRGLSPDRVDRLRRILEPGR